LVSTKELPHGNDSLPQHGLCGHVPGNLYSSPLMSLLCRSYPSDQKREWGSMDDATAREPLTEEERTKFEHYPAEIFSCMGLDLTSSGGKIPRDAGLLRCGI
jgi:hypothetical protein